MKHLVVLSIVVVAGLFHTAQRAAATPYCSQLLDETRLAPKYQRLAPIYSSTDTGWIFTSDQLKPKYDMKPEAKEIMREIVSEFSEMGLPLAILIAPPRPVVAGQSILDATMSPQNYDTRHAASSFDKLITQLQSLGAITPNLLSIARANTSAERPFYFKRDTHWTTHGVVLSATELGRFVRIRLPETFGNESSNSPKDLSISGTLEERGSLADIVRATCKNNPEHEFTPSFDLGATQSDNEMSLLGPTVRLGPRVALLGSSFSDRYKRDHYRVVEALTGALHADVDNYSISGAGMIGAIESFVLFYASNPRAYDLVLWETPYTESFNIMSKLRQLLGALQSRRADRVESDSVWLARSGKNTVTYPTGLPPADLLFVDAKSTDLQELIVRVKFTSGKPEKYRLTRKKHIPLARRSEVWALSLKGLDRAQISQITLEFDSGRTGENAAMYLMRVPK